MILPPNEAIRMRTCKDVDKSSIIFKKRFLCTCLRFGHSDSCYLKENTHKDNCDKDKKTCFRNIRMCKSK